MMKKSIFFVFIFSLLLCLTVDVFAQQKSTAQVAKSVDNGSKVFFTGIGIYTPGSIGGLRVPPVLAGFEYLVKFHPKVPISFGGVFSYSQTGTNYFFYTDDWVYHNFTVLARSAYHFTELIPNAKLMQKLDLYAGIAAGFTIYSVSEPAGLENVFDADVGRFDWGIFAGARYFFTPGFGVYAETGYTIGILNAGVAFKF